MEVLIARMRERVERSRSESDVALFQDLLLFGELLVKVHVAALVAALEDDSDRNRYRIEHNLVRADSIGKWVDAGAEILSGPAFMAVADEAKRMLGPFVTREAEGSWKYASTVQLERALRVVGSQTQLTARAKLGFLDWLRGFVELRNKTRGHGALLPAIQSSVCDPLLASLEAVASNSEILKLECAYLKQNLSGKYRVTRLSESDESFSAYKTRTDCVASEGIYVCWGQPRPMHLLFADPDAQDFFFPNGDFKSSGFECLSYVTGAHIRRDATPFLSPPSHLPSSGTEGLAEFDAFGECMANLPPDPTGYIPRDRIDSELSSILRDDRHPVVTLVGRGGIGKTYSALRACHELAKHGEFALIVWFSSRDIELEQAGPRPVRPHLLDEKDIASEFTRLMNPIAKGDKSFDAVAYFVSELRIGSFGKTLFVFDNFETARNPIDLYSWVNANIRLPNKVLVTTRHREFRGDYHIEVGGMTESESKRLIETVWRSLGSPFDLSSAYVDSLVSESSGHPYVLKILLGEAAAGRKESTVKRVLARRDDVLDALFERTFAAVSEPARRVFLTLCAWRTAVPDILLEAVINRPGNERVDFDQAVDQLEMFSFVTATEAEGGQRFLHLPLPAFLFGQKKYAVSPFRATIQQDVDLLRLSGAGAASGAARAVEMRLHQLFRGIAAKVSEDQRRFDDFRPILESLAHGFPQAFKWLAQLCVDELPQDRGRPLAIGYFYRFLENPPASEELSRVWKELSELHRAEGDVRGMYHALVELCTLPDTPFHVVCETANLLNRLHGEYKRQLDRDTYRALLKDAASAFEARISEGSAVDYSKLGWLWMNAGDPEKAYAAAKRGLGLDGSEVHCQSLVEKLG